MDELARELQKHMKGEVSIDEALRDERKHDASVFELMPAIVVFPKDTPDLQELVSFVTRSVYDDNGIINSFFLANVNFH